MEITPKLLRKYEEGLCVPAEEQAVLQWLDQQEETEDLFPFPERETEIRQQIWSTIDPCPEVKPVKKRIPLFYRRLIGITAAAALLITVSCWWLYSGYKALPSRVGPAMAWRTSSTANGEKQRLMLPDSTVVLLNGGSSIRYPEQFTDSFRVVYVTGEAFLEVTRKAAQPFVLHTTATAVRVLGTAFNVQAYEKDPYTCVTVEEGSVAFVAPDKRQVVLTAGQQGRYLHGGTIRQQNVYVPAYTAWRNNKLVLADKTLPEIAILLERWYNTEIIINSRKLQQERFTGEFERASLEQVLKQIAFVLKCHYKTENNKVIIY